MDLLINLQDTTGNPIDGYVTISGISYGSTTSGAIIISPIPSSELYIEVIPNDSNLASYSGYIPFIFAATSLSDISLTITFLELNNFDFTFIPSITEGFEIIKAKCSSAVLVVPTIAASINLAYEWNWGDGEPISNGSYATHSYLYTGTYNIGMKFTVCNDGAVPNVDFCPCPPHSIFTETVVVPVEVLPGVFEYNIPIVNNFSTCCVPNPVAIAIFADGVNQGTNFGGISLQTTTVDDTTTDITYWIDTSVVSGVSASTFAIQPSVVNSEACNFSIPMVFDFSIFANSTSNLKGSGGTPLVQPLATVSGLTFTLRRSNIQADLSQDISMRFETLDTSLMPTFNIQIEGSNDYTATYSMNSFQERTEEVELKYETVGTYLIRVTSSVAGVIFDETFLTVVVQ